MQIMKTTANNTSGSGIRAEKRENSFNQIIGSRHAGYSRVSHEVSGS